MSERIYARNPDGGIEPLEEERFEFEDHLQDLIAAHPELLDGEQMRPGDPLRWLLVTREKGVSQPKGKKATAGPSTSSSSTRTRCRRWWRSSAALITEIRRTVIGQMLEYAAHAAQTWTAGELRHSFEVSAEARGVEPADELRNFLGTAPRIRRTWRGARRAVTSGSEWRPTSTRAACASSSWPTNCPDELKRVVEFLNAQMPKIEVLAVEIKQFRGRLRADTSAAHLWGHSPQTRSLFPLGRRSTT